MTGFQPPLPYPWPTSLCGIVLAFCVSLPGVAAADPAAIEYRDPVPGPAERCSDRRTADGMPGFRLGRFCYACPMGHTPAPAPAAPKDACLLAGRPAPALKLGPMGCPGPMAFGFRGRCYRCPQGFRRTKIRGGRCFRPRPAN